MIRLFATTAAAALALTLATALVPVEQAGAATASCPKPRALAFTRKQGSTVGILRWRAPKLPKTAAGYRVYRDRAVVGQTRKRVLKVKVSAGRKVTFSVRVALRNGKTLPCRAVLVRRVLWKPPTTPRNVTVQQNDEGLLVEWSKSKRGEGVLVGYRVFKDGLALRQVTTLSAVVPLPPLRTATLQVAAVDSRGKLSPLSTPLSVVRGHSPPSVPSGLGGSALSDREIEVSWAPSTGNGGVGISYQVRRNGQLLTQTTATTVRASNLFPATQYSFTVTAVDSLGYRSAESSPFATSTQGPPQTAGGTYAFLLASTSSSFADLQEHYGNIGTVIPTYFDCLSDGSFEGRDDPLVTGWSKLRGLKVHARWNCQRTSTLSSILRDSGKREATISGIVNTVVANGYDGANLDFEAGAAADRDVFTSFVHDLADRLHGAGKVLSVDVSAKTKDVKNHPRSTFYDYDALSGSADVIIVMAWGIHWATSVPGAIDELPWVTNVANYVAGRPNRSKFVLGFGLYGFDWPGGGGSSANKATALNYPDVMALAARVGATPSVDSGAQAPRFSYDAGGVRHDVWYVDAASLAQRLDVARGRGLGIALWRLGQEDPAIWGLGPLQP